jgi:hypothetical protein
VTTGAVGTDAGVAEEGNEDWTHPPIRTNSIIVNEMMKIKYFFISGNLSRHRLILLSFPIIPS